MLELRAATTFQEASRQTRGDPRFDQSTVNEVSDTGLPQSHPCKGLARREAGRAVLRNAV